MQLSEDRIDWIANAHCPSGTAYPSQVKNAIREALAEALRAQADARPVAWMDDGSTRNGSESTSYRVVTDQTKRNMPSAAAQAYTTPLYTHPEASADRRFFFDEAELDALYEAIEWAKDEGLPGTAEHLQAIFDAHDPEASAPGLSEEDRRIFMESSTELARHGHKQHAMAIASFLTRASAATVADTCEAPCGDMKCAVQCEKGATVAEPSEPAQQVGEPYTFRNAADVLRAKRDGTQFYLRDGDRAPVKVDSIKGREHGVYVGGKGIMPYWITPNGYGERPDIWLFAAQQQAEPGDTNGGQK